MSYHFVLFAVLAMLSLAGALSTVAQRNPVYSARSRAGTMVCLAGLYLLMRAPYVAMVQVALYAGAIVVLFLFVVMTVDLARLGDQPDSSREQLLTGTLVATALFGTLAVTVTASLAEVVPVAEAANVDDPQNVQAVARALFRFNALPFEMTSLLLLAALIGVVVFTWRRRRRDDE